MKGKESMSETSSENTPRKKQGMFTRPFIFIGTINRKEYALSLLIVVALLCISVWICGALTDAYGDNDYVLFLFLVLRIVFSWFLLAQGAKRCHEIGLSGWWQIVPFFWVFLLVKKGADNEWERYE